MSEPKADQESLFPSLVLKRVLRSLWSPAHEFWCADGYFNQDDSGAIGFALRQKTRREVKRTPILRYFQKKSSSKIL